MIKLQKALYEYTCNVKGPPGCNANSEQEKKLQENFLNELLEVIREEISQSISAHEHDRQEEM